MNHRTLIVNADDFGQSPGVNRGVARAHERGILTSASLMTRWPAAGEAGDYARRCPRLSVGLHFDLGEFKYEAGEWVRRYHVFADGDDGSIHTELARQLRSFEALVGRPPTHLDSHQHAHRDEPVRTIVGEMARRLDIPVRHVTSAITYVGGFYGQDDHGASYPELVGVQSLLAILAGLGSGITELACHPSAADDLESMYGAERIIELETLCDPGVRMAVDRLGIELRSFHDWR